jgi:hypothetical protein
MCKYTSLLGMAGSTNRQADSMVAKPQNLTTLKTKFAIGHAKGPVELFTFIFLKLMLVPSFCFFLGF